jgi:hypothetical protein
MNARRRKLFHIQQTRDCQGKERQGHTDLVTNDLPEERFQCIKTQKTKQSHDINDQKNLSNDKKDASRLQDLKPVILTNYGSSKEKHNNASCEVRTRVSGYFGIVSL